MNGEGGRVNGGVGRVICKGRLWAFKRIFVAFFILKGRTWVGWDFLFLILFYGFSGVVVKRWFAIMFVIQYFESTSLYLSVFESRADMLDPLYWYVGCIPKPFYLFTNSVTQTNSVADPFRQIITDLHQIPPLCFSFSFLFFPPRVKRNAVQKQS